MLAEAEWQERRARHENRVDGWLVGVADRRRRGVAHPVQDFLFEYYSFRPAELRRWHPGAGVVLGGDAARELLGRRHYVEADGGVRLDVEAVLAVRSKTVSWAQQLLAATAARPGWFGCFGMHEWAMVYRQPAGERRHSGVALRFSDDELAAVVEERGVRCGHFDAFRFFTPAARSLNVLQPTRQDQPELEQPGCLHTNMDLYKYAYKLSPLVSSELVADAFALARDIREVDMRASPYDLSALGYAAVAVETAEGRATYAAAQRDFAARAAPVRQALLEVIDGFVA